MNPKLELKVAELGINEAFMTGLVEEVCIYINSLGFLERGFRTNIVKGCTAPFYEEKGREAFRELMECGAKMGDDILKTLSKGLCRLPNVILSKQVYI